MLLPCVAIEKELCTLVISLVKFVIVYLTPSFVFKSITQSPAFLLLSPSPQSTFPETLCLQFDAERSQSELGG